MHNVVAVARGMHEPTVCKGEGRCRYCVWDMNSSGLDVGLRVVRLDVASELSGSTATDKTNQQLCVFANLLQAWRTYTYADVLPACNVENAYSHCRVCHW